MARFPIKSFKACGYCQEPSRHIEIEISPANDAARYRITQSTSKGVTVFFGYWQEIKADKRGRLYTNDWSNYKNRKAKKRLYLDRFLQY